jgi:hypothetical protein
MEWHSVAGIVAGTIAVLSTIPYVWSIFYGTTRPSIISQSLWFLFVVLALIGQYAAEGLSWSMATGIATGTNNLILIVICLLGNGYAGHSRLDWISAGIALTGLALWQVTRIPEIAILFAIIATAAAGMPTYRKTWHFPETENTLTWFLIFVSAVISLTLVEAYTFAGVALLIFFCFEALLVVWFSLQKPKTTVV